MQALECNYCATLYTFCKRDNCLLLSIQALIYFLRRMYKAVITTRIQRIVDMATIWKIRWNWGGIWQSTNKQRDNQRNWKTINQDIMPCRQVHRKFPSNLHRGNSPSHYDEECQYSQQTYPPPWNNYSSIPLPLLPQTPTFHQIEEDNPSWWEPHLQRSGRRTLPHTPP